MPMVYNSSMDNIWNQPIESFSHEEQTELFLQFRVVPWLRPAIKDALQSGKAVLVEENYYGQTYSVDGTPFVSDISIRRIGHYHHASRTGRSQ